MGSKLLLILGLSIAGLLVFSILGYALAIPLFGVGLEELSNLENYRTVQAMKFAQAFVTIGTFLVPALLYAKIDKKPMFLFFQMGSIRFDLMMVTILLAFSAIPLIGWLAEWNNGMVLPEFLSWLETWMRETEDKAMVITEAFLDIGTGPELLINLLVIAALPAIGEEFLFRGAVQNTIINFKKNPHLAIWVTAFIFSAIHLQFYGFIPRLLLGAIFGYLAYWSGSIWYAVLAHFINNATSVYLMYLIKTGSIDPQLEHFGGNADDWFYALIGAFAVIVFISFFRFLVISRELFNLR